MDDLSRVIRIGQVSSINSKNGAVRIAYDDMTDGTGKEFVSAEMQVLQRNSGIVKHNSQPAVGEHVVTLQLPNGPQEGFVLGSVYTAENMQIVSDPGVEYALYPDGTIIEYNSNSSKYTIKGAGCHIIVDCLDSTITLKEFAKVNAKDIEVTCETAKVTAQTVEVNAQSAKVTAQAADVAASTITLTGTVQINGNVTVMGSLNASGNITDGGGNTNHHTH